MSVEAIYCPSCNSKLRVGSDMRGDEVECPKCGAIFRAPPPDDVSPIRAARERYDDFEERPRRPRPRDDDDRWEERPPAGAAIVAPGIAMLVLGGLSLLINLAQVILCLAAPDFVRQTQMNNPFANLAGNPAGGPDPVILETIAGFIFGFVGLINLLAGIAMTTRRYYGLAVAGSILAMLNCSNLCCVLGLPIGIWSLVVLMNAENKAAFS